MNKFASENIILPPAGLSTLLIYAIGKSKGEYLNILVELKD
jgi:hypothetical protein